MSSLSLSGVILAAGKGTRLYPITEKIPKPLVPIGHKSLIEYQLDILKGLGIKKCYIVIGHFGYEIAKLLGNGDKYGMQIEYVEQKEALGIANALTQAANRVNGSGKFLLMLGDIFFETGDLNAMVDLMENKGANAVLATKVENDPYALKKNFAIHYDAEGRVHKVIEKPTKLLNNLKGCGMYLFDNNIFEAVNRTPRTALRNEYEITDSIQLFIDAGYKVYYSNVINDDLNITFIQDLYNINMDYLHKDNKDVVLGENVEIAENVQLTNVVIGNDVRISEDVVLNDTLVLSESYVKKGEKISHSIVTRDHIIRM
ncbi:MAG: sugar phosphate nucleotidyltransferase [Acidobacteria bacterium]|nr:sugar phosphate nucleotidyltransferase [Acidobacteriota bacterium]